MTSCSSKRTRPCSGSIIPTVMRKVVVFPAPLRPEEADDLSAGDEETQPVDDRAAVVSA